MRFIYLFGFAKEKKDEKFSTICMFGAFGLLLFHVIFVCLCISYNCDVCFSSHGQDALLVRNEHTKNNIMCQMIYTLFYGSFAFCICF